MYKRQLPDFEYDGSDPIEKLVYATEIEKYSQPQRGFTIVAPKIFGSYEEGGLLKVFVTTFSATYKLYGNVLDLSLIHILELHYTTPLNCYSIADW